MTTERSTHDVQMRMDEGTIVTFSVSIVGERGTVDSVSQGRRNPTGEMVANMVLTMIAQLHPALVKSTTKSLTEMLNGTDKS